MERPIKAWVLEEKQGGRKGKWMKGPGIPFHFPIKTALFHAKNDAIRYLLNSRTEDQYSLVCVEISIKRREHEPK